MNELFNQLIVEHFILKTETFKVKMYINIDVSMILSWCHIYHMNLGEPLYCTIRVGLPLVVHIWLAMQLWDQDT